MSTVRAFAWVASLGACGAIAACAIASCTHDDARAQDDAGDSCAILFGTPSAQTGLGPDRCQPICACGADVYAPPTYDAAFIQSLVDDWRLATPYPALSADPYAGPAPADDPPGTVCAVVPRSPAGTTPRAYDLATFASIDAARAAGASPTHYGHCGVCSTLANLAVYMRENDLGAKARACALTKSPDAGDGNVACLMQLGFDLPCAQAWAYDANHTREQCLGVCLAHVSDPYNEPDGALSPCIACDEVQSGPVFKAVAGRTRRNSGLPNAICRPCSEVLPLVHSY